MIIIKDLSLDYVSKLDMFFGYLWRDKKLRPSELSRGCVDVMLSRDAEIFACSSNSRIMIQYQGLKIYIDVERFSEVIIA